jgi:hypothetical protein
MSDVQALPDSINEAQNEECDWDDTKYWRCVMCWAFNLIERKSCSLCRAPHIASWRIKSNTADLVEENNGQ